MKSSNSAAPASATIHDLCSCHRVKILVQRCTRGDCYAGCAHGCVRVAVPVFFRFVSGRVVASGYACACEVRDGWAEI